MSHSMSHTQNRARRMSRQSNARWVEHAGTKLCFVPKQCLQCLQLGLTLGFNGAALHTRIAWATMDFATVRQPLVTPFWGLSIVEVINTYLQFVFLSFILDPFSHLRVLKRRQSWDNRFGTLWWISVHLYMKWCIWLLHFWLGIGKILYFLGGTLWWVESGH